MARGAKDGPGDGSHKPKDNVIVANSKPDVGLGRGKVFPATHARSLLNPLRHLVQSPRRTISAMGLAADARVLEIGAGPGFFSPSIADFVPRGAVIVLDLQAEMLHLAHGRTVVGHPLGPGRRDEASLLKRALRRCVDRLRSRRGPEPEQLFG